MKKIFKTAAVVAGISLLSACAGVGPKVDPLSYQITPADAERVSVPDECKSSYKISTPNIAVVAFTNNTTYGDMTATNTTVNQQAQINNVSAGAAGIVAAPGAAGIGYVGASQTNIASNTLADTFTRQISSKVGEYAQSAVESTLSKMGGVNLYDRTQLDKVMAEQKFQMTVADPDTAVKLGKMAGVDYIITGTVDNISTKYFDKIDTKNNVGGNLGAFLSIASIAANTQTGWIINVEMTVSMIDVSTGQVIVSKKVSGRENGGNARNFNAEASLTAAKKAMGEAVEDIKPLFSEKFSQKGYIQQLRGGKKVALINLGSDKGMESGTKLGVYDFVTVTDPFTNVTTCNMSKIPVTLTVTDQIQPAQSWVSVDGKEDVLKRVKVGSIIMREKEEGQSFMKKLF